MAGFFVQGPNVICPFKVSEAPTTTCRTPFESVTHLLAATLIGQITFGPCPKKLAK